MLVIAITISAIAAWYSVAGLTAIFAAAVIPVIIMGGALEAGKIVATVWLHNNWARVSWAYKTYLVPAIVFLMLLTSMGIFGFLSKAHSDQSLVSGDAMSKIAIYDEKIATEKDNIAQAKRALEQMNAQVDQMLGRSDNERGAERAVSIRKNQSRERAALQAEITHSQKTIQKLQEERSPLAAEFRKVEAEVGPIKYIAAFIYGDNPDQNVLERAVRWVIILIVIVFDPLALCLILAANKQLEWARQGVGGWVHDEEHPKVVDADHTAEDEVPQPLQPEHPTTEEETPPAIEPAPELTEEQLEQIRAHAANEAVATLPEPEPIIEVVEEEMASDIADLQLPVTPTITPEQQVFLDEAPSIIEDLNSELVAKQQEYDSLLNNFNRLKEDSSDFIGYKNRLDAELNALRAQMEEVEASRNVEHQRANNLSAQIMELLHPVAPKSVAPLEPKPVEYIAPEFKEPPKSSFGTVFPESPSKGDLYLRTDYLPSLLFKFNGISWIEADKTKTDTYAFNDAYIEYLIEKLKTGEYDSDDLTEVEHEQIAQYLQGKNGSNG